MSQSRTTENKQLLQLKINYLEFMQQILERFEPRITKVLFSILMERDYITQEQIMLLTGLKRSVVSETLGELTSQTSRFPILQTRKANDNKKYYYSPLDFNQYIKTFFTAAIDNAIFNIDFFPKMLRRLNTLTTRDNQAVYLEEVFAFFLLISKYYLALTKAINEDWEDFVRNPHQLPEFSQQMDEIDREFDDLISKIKSTSSKKNPNDSLIKIKKKYIDANLEAITPLGRRRESAAVLQTLFLENQPVTQDDIMKITDYSRSTVSESLTKLIERNLIEVVKLPKIRKKYYKIKFSLIGYGFAQFNRSIQTLDRIVLMIEQNFLAELGTVGGSKDEKKSLEKFFQENITAYKLMKDYMTSYHQTIADRLSF